MAKKIKGKKGYKKKKKKRKDGVIQAYWVKIKTRYNPPFKVEDRPADIPREEYNRRRKVYKSKKPTYAIQDTKTGKFLGSTTSTQLKKADKKKKKT